MRKRIEKIIIKHYGKGKKFKNRGWEQCGNEIESLIRDEEDKIRNKSLPYSEECDLKDKVRKNIEDIYESYFKVGSMYAWIDGNSTLKELIGE